MGIILLVLLLALILGGLGFAVHILWWIALVVLVIWLIGFVVRVGEGTSRRRWYRWLRPPSAAGTSPAAGLSEGAAGGLDGLIAAVADPELLTSAVRERSTRWNTADDRLFRSVRRPARGAPTSSCG